RLCDRVGYLGVGDTDWRLDPRDGRLKLVDFNPRIGAQFQLFRSTTGLDVARALHLGMSQRAAAAGEQIDMRELVVEHLDAAAVPTGLLRRGGSQGGNQGRGQGRGRPFRHGRREPAWFAWDDPLPFAAATARFALDAARKAAIALRRRSLSDE